MSKACPHVPRSVILFIALIVILAVIVYLAFSPEESKEPSPAAGFDTTAYINEVNRSRLLKDMEITDSAKSRFNTEERRSFTKKGLQYFTPDLLYRVEVTFTVDTSTAVFKMPTTTDRAPDYRIYGTINFTLHDTACRLTAYQSMDYINHPEYGGYLFVPFSDKTNGSETYGAGRYLDIAIPVENSFVLDFNEAYNPYCAYADRWSCPLVPLENYLDVTIRAGEKKYKH